LNDSAKKQPVHNDSEPSQTEFKSLVQRGREGDQEAIGSLLSNYRNYMLLIANQDLDQAVRSKLGASDVVQQSMILAQQNFAQFRGDSENELKAWIRKILQNDLLNVRRHYGTTQQRQVDREIRFQDSKIHHIELLDPNNTPQSEVLLKELAVELERCLDQLSESHRNVIRLRNWQENPLSRLAKFWAVPTMRRENFGFVLSMDSKKLS